MTGAPDQVVAAHLSVSSGPNTLDSELVAVRAAQQHGLSRDLPAGV